MSPEIAVDLAGTGTRGAKSGLSLVGQRSNLLLRRSMSRSCLEKKSAPSIGLGTSARKNSWEAQRFLKWRSLVTVPNVGMEVPLAACREVVHGELDPLCADEGKTETSAPLSTRKSRLDTRSERHNDRDVVSAA